MAEFDSEVQASVVVDAPVREVYNQWTQFEEFPYFMEGIQEVRQLDDKRLFWRAEIGGQEKTWEAEIVDQTPDERIAWRSIAGANNGGAVLFKPRPDGKTEITLRIRYDTEGTKEKVGDALGVVKRQVEGDLKRFAKFMSERHAPGWRGEIHGKQVVQSRH